MKGKGKGDKGPPSLGLGAGGRIGIPKKNWREQDALRKQRRDAKKLPKLELSQCTRMDINCLDWETATGYSRSGAGASGVFFAEFATEDQPHGVVVVKGLTNPCGFMFCTLLAQSISSSEMLQSCPKARLVACSNSSLEWHSLKAKLMEMAGNTMFGPAVSEQHKVGGNLDRPVLVIMEFMRGRNLMQLSRDSLRPLLASPEQLIRIAEAVALDVLFNNHDRIPILECWDPMGLRGNPNNLMSCTDQLTLIDLNLIPLQDKELLDEYLVLVRQLLEQLSAATPGALQPAVRAQGLCRVSSHGPTAGLGSCVGSTEALIAAAAQETEPQRLARWQEENDVVEIVPAVFMMAEHFQVHMGYGVSLAALRALQHGLIRGFQKLAAELDRAKLEQLKQVVGTTTFEPGALERMRDRHIWKQDMAKLDIEYLTSVLDVIQEYAGKLGESDYVHCIQGAVGESIDDFVKNTTLESWMA